VGEKRVGEKRVGEKRVGEKRRDDGMGSGRRIERMKNEQERTRKSKKRNKKEE
jgi:hypothetical protein